MCRMRLIFIIMMKVLIIETVHFRDIPINKTIQKGIALMPSLYL